MSFNSGWDYSDTIRAPDAGQAIAAFYAGKYRHSPLAEWERRLANGEILRNGHAAGAADTIRAGDHLLWRRPPWNEGAFPEDLPIIYSDASIVAIDKPAGLSTMPDGGWMENSLVGWLRRRFGRDAPAPAHRLNRGTSGIVLCARTPAARAALARQFLEKTASAHSVGAAASPASAVSARPVCAVLQTAQARGLGREAPALAKTYLAATIPPPAGIPRHPFAITAPIGKVPHPILGHVFAASPAGKPALSECQIVSESGGFALWRVNLVTGRPHQIRIHLASIGAPLLGEPLFLPGGAPRLSALPGDCGYFLRALSISFTHPASGDRVTISVPPDAHFGIIPTGARTSCTSSIGYSSRCQWHSSSSPQSAPSATSTAWPTSSPPDASPAATSYA